MKKITNDLEAIALIKFLYKGGPNTEEEWDKIEDLLEEYQVGISNTIRDSNTFIEPQEVLRIARERNKPIIL